MIIMIGNIKKISVSRNKKFRMMVTKRGIIKKNYFDDNNIDSYELYNANSQMISKVHIKVK